MRRRSITDVASYLKWLASIDADMMYRGQGADLPLLPSIARMRGIDRVLPTYENWQVLQLDLIERFAKYARPLLHPAPADSEEWLVHAQHYGVPTRLLDWSRNPLVALFWAVENVTQDNVDGVVWAFSPRHWRDDSLAPTPLDDMRLTPYFPKLLNPRIMAQEGCFVAFPLPPSYASLKPMNARGAYSNDIDAVTVARVPARKKNQLRIELRILGITHRLVYPDLPGIAASIKAELVET